MPAYRTRDASAHNLEVTTDAPPPPTVSIISPTPRAFTFPITDTRFPASPSSSPFEPTLKSIPSTPPPLRPFSPTSSIGSDSSISVPESVLSASTLSSPSAPASSQASHRRRRSTASDIGERRPKKGDDDYIKRPENAFILFRRQRCTQRQAEREEEASVSGPVKKQRQADLSKTISQQWKSLSAGERQYWEDLAKEKKKEHEKRYPNYVYRPQRNKDKKTKKGKGRREGDQDTDAESFSFLVPVSSPSRSPHRDYAAGGHGPGHGRRAVSAPTPPPAFQAIQLPTVWMPSCPGSPTLVPRISGRTPAPVANIPPPTESAPLTTFDYAPNDQLFTASHEVIDMFPYNAQQSNGTYRGMYMLPEGIIGGPLLHALSIPRDSTMSSNMMSPTESITSTLVSPSEYASPPESSYGSSVSSISSTGTQAPFTPEEALRMMSLGIPNQEDVPENVDSEAAVSEMPMPYGFWPPPETIWANMETLMNDDFNLGSIPPVELGLAQFDTVQPSTTCSASSSSSTLRPEPEYEAREEYATHMSEEHDFHDATPGLDRYSGVFAAHDSMNW